MGRGGATTTDKNVLYNRAGTRSRSGSLDGNKEGIDYSIRDEANPLELDNFSPREMRIFGAFLEALKASSGRPVSSTEVYSLWEQEHSGITPADFERKLFRICEQGVLVRRATAAQPPVWELTPEGEIFADQF